MHICAIAEVVRIRADIIWHRTESKARMVTITYTILIHHPYNTGRERERAMLYSLAQAGAENKRAPPCLVPPPPPQHLAFPRYIMRIMRGMYVCVDIFTCTVIICIVDQLLEAAYRLGQPRL